MEIWLVCLVLCISDDCYNYETFFRCEKVKGAFKDNGTEYIQTDAIEWSRKVISKEITITRPSGQYRVVKGFEYKPNDKELETIKMEMKRMLNECISVERNRYLHDVERKFKGLLSK